MNKITIKFLTLLVFFAMSLFSSCSKSEENDNNTNSGNNNTNSGNYVKLNSVSYAISSAGYYIEDGNLTIQFETTDPDVFLYFKEKDAIPLGETSVSYESTDDNCFITYCFENEDFLSINGSVTISRNGSSYQVSAEGNISSMTNEVRTYKINYQGELTEINHGGSGSGSGSGGSGGGSHSNNSFTVSPVFSYFESQGGEGSINVHCDNENMTWTVTCDSDWCEFTTDHGVGSSTVGIVVVQNQSNTDRSAKITFTSGDSKEKQRAHVFQKPGAYDIVVNPDALEYSAFGGERIVHVYINNQNYPLNWTATCNSSWVHLSQTSGTASTDINVTVDNTSSGRTAEIRFESEKGTVRFVAIHQKAAEDVKVFINRAEYQVQQNNNMAVKVRYNINNQSTSYTLYYLKFRVTHPSGSVTQHEIGSRTNTTQWNLMPGGSVLTNYYNCNIPYQDGVVKGDILDALFY